MDRSNFFIFSNKGKFLKKNKRGRGPGELTRAMNFSLDKIRNEIYIIEMGNILHIYNHLADYKETHKLDGSFIDAIRIDDNNYQPRNERCIFRQSAVVHISVNVKKPAGISQGKA